MVICLERGADFHMAQRMPLPLTVSCFSKIKIGLHFWYRLTWVVLDKGPLNGCVCVCVKAQTDASLTAGQYMPQTTTETEIWGVDTDAVDSFLDVECDVTTRWLGNAGELVASQQRVHAEVWQRTRHLKHVVLHATHTHTQLITACQYQLL